MLCICAGALVALAAGPGAAAHAAPPAGVAITAPSNGSVIGTQTPTISGTTESLIEFGLEKTVTVAIYRGTPSEGRPVGEPLQKLTTGVAGAQWAVSSEMLEQGTYTVQARDSELPLPSAPVTFTIDTTAPRVALTSPASGGSAVGGSQALAGSAGTEAGDLPQITVQLFVGGSIGAQPPLEAVTVQAVQGSWSATLSGLNPGTYTARAEQADEAGNVGTSAPVTFTLLPVPAPPPPQSPLASFKWFPTVPVVGEPVLLVSNSTDQTSPLSTFAWAFGNGAFSVGRQVLTTTFTTPGIHVVRLRVSAANGLSSVASATLDVIRAQATLMAPFPVVRIAGVLTSSGANLSLITAQAPRGARVRVSCRGRGCPTASESRLVGLSSGKRRAGVLVFRRFERSLPAGVILEIRISKPGSIGKYTRFTIRRGKLPARVDSCLDPAGLRPIPCPTS